MHILYSRVLDVCVYLGVDDVRVKAVATVGIAGDGS